MNLREMFDPERENRALDDLEAISTAVSALIAEGERQDRAHVRVRVVAVRAERVAMSPEDYLASPLADADEIEDDVDRVRRYMAASRHTREWLPTTDDVRRILRQRTEVRPRVGDSTL